MWVCGRGSGRSGLRMLHATAPTSKTTGIPTRSPTARRRDTGATVPGRPAAPPLLGGRTTRSRELPSPFGAITCDSECRAVPAADWVTRRIQRGKGEPDEAIQEGGACGRAREPCRHSDARDRRCSDCGSRSYEGAAHREVVEGNPTVSCGHGRRRQHQDREQRSSIAGYTDGRIRITARGGNPDRIRAGSSSTFTPSTSRRSSSRAATARTSTTYTGPDSDDGPDTAAEQRRAEPADQPRGVLLRPEGRAGPER